MPDRIQISDLLLRTIIGINNEEREKKQDVVINITLHVDLRNAGRSDDISDAVNYRTITKEIIDLVENSRFQLVEKMADEVAKICLTDQRVEQASVSIEKPGALRFTRSVGVTVERTREDFSEV
ncbi:MAG: dihydroneopterin aldolase [Planctomycetes bacterium]|nr:dihydroneopterin aldolase [Planctomycetota bacterium]MCH9727766.1 dihydroneopterin aldolase [Planctomycetota bacterium]MCH9776909.1 dihydroneopterin aldolase [Planctomycetota bacterium]MDF1744551.1 dihydroneopterin aldolase [Gimesia sp.]